MAGLGYLTEPQSTPGFEDQTPTDFKFTPGDSAGAAFELAIESSPTKSIANIIGRKITGGRLSKDEEHKFDRAWKIASLINNFGKMAVFVLSGHGIGADTCARILRNYTDDENLLKTIYEAEKQYVMTRGFWDN